MDQQEEDGGAREPRGTTVLAKRVHTSPGTSSPPAGGSGQIDNPRSWEHGKLCQQVRRGRPTRRGWGGGGGSLPPSNMGPLHDGPDWL